MSQQSEQVPDSEEVKETIRRLYLIGAVWLVLTLVSAGAGSLALYGHRLSSNLDGLILSSGGIACLVTPGLAVAIISAARRIHSTNGVFLGFLGLLLNLSGLGLGILYVIRRTMG